ncbi:MAG: caspase family protein [Myxococcota bacterium]
MARRALLIGINEYRTINNLRGCGNDVFNVSGLLREQAGFQSSEIRALAHDRATKRNIEERIGWLVNDARRGDVLVLHFSGHGTQVRDRNGSELNDSLDEVLCPYDMDWDGTFISDDYLRDKLQVPDGVVLEVILDACHSGQGSTQVSFSGSGVNVSDPDRQPRFIEPPVDILVRNAGQRLPVKRLFRSPSVRSHVVLWSACAEFQTAADARINGVFNGVFTFYFCEHLRQSGGALSRAELLSRVQTSLAQAGYSQIPELSAVDALQSARTFSL